MDSQDEFTELHLGKLLGKLLIQMNVCNYVLICKVWSTISHKTDSPFILRYKL